MKEFRLLWHCSILFLIVYFLPQNAFAKQLEKFFGGNDREWGFSVQQTTDGGYIIVGKTESFGAGGGDVYLVKTDATGDKQWEKTFGGLDSDTGESVEQTTDGGYIIVGFIAYSDSGGSDVYLIKTDENGDKQRENTL